MDERPESVPVEERLGRTCDECGHNFDEHHLVATMHSAQHGGLIFCHLQGCLCEMTWSVDDLERPYIPDAETVAQLRALVQNPDNEQ